MAVLFQDRTVSMILMVPDVELLNSSTSTEKKVSTRESMPVYHGSIVRIEQRADDETTSDLIVRVPNFQRLSLPSMTISNDSSLTDGHSTGLYRTKRRAPICPLLHGSPHPPNPLKMSSPTPISPTSLHAVPTHRLTEGIRSISRALTHGCRSKRSSSITEVTYPSPLPDVEVMKERLPTSNDGSTTKFTTPKIFFLKRQVKQTRLHSSTDPSPPASTEPVYYAEVSKTMSKTTSFMHRFELDREEEEEDLDEPVEPATSIDLMSEVTQSLPSLAQMNPVSSLDDTPSLSKHRYSTISAIVTDIRNIVSDQETDEIVLKPPRTFHVPTSLLQPDISVIRVGTNHFPSDLTTQPLTEEIEPETSDDVLSECYEVTYQIDRQPATPNNTPPSSPTRIHLDPMEYKDLATAMTAWLPILPRLPSNLYEQIDQETSEQSSEKKVNSSSSVDLTSTKSRSLEDLSLSTSSARRCIVQRSNSYNGFGLTISTDLGTSHEHLIRQVEPMSPSDQAGLKENDRILCINGTPIIEEDYTVVLQLLQQSFQSDQLDIHVMNNDAYEEFHRQIDELYASSSVKSMD